MSKIKITPLHNHVVIKQQEESETMHGRLIIPDAGKEKAMMGEVIAVGPGIINLNGHLIPTTLKVGQIVTFPAFGGQKITIKGEEYLIYKEPDIFALLEEEPAEIPNRLPSELVNELVSNTTLLDKNAITTYTNK